MVHIPRGIVKSEVSGMLYISIQAFKFIKVEDKDSVECSLNIHRTIGFSTTGGKRK